MESKRKMVSAIYGRAGTVCLLLMLQVHGSFNTQRVQYQLVSRRSGLFVGATSMGDVHAMGVMHSKSMRAAMGTGVSAIWGPHPNISSDLRAPGVPQFLAFWALALDLTEGPNRYCIPRSLALLCPHGPISLVLWGSVVPITLAVSGRGAPK